MCALELHDGVFRGKGLGFNPAKRQFRSKKLYPMPHFFLLPFSTTNVSN